MIEAMMTKRTLKNNFLQVEYLTTALRITGLVPTGKSNLMADLSSSSPTPTPYGDYHFLGGHRLWHAPEAMPRSYIPDDGEIIITDLSNGVILEGKTEPGAGIRKRIEIFLAANKPSAIVTHTLINDGLWPVELSPWAITQFRLGGTVILPMPVGNVDTAGLLHNRQFSLWPYSRINDPRLKLDDRFILFKADALPPFKIGTFNSDGWLAYWVDGILFRKAFNVQAGLAHPDNNCNAEMYCGNLFVELESLAPLTTLHPGESVDHVETWDIFDGMDSVPEEIQQVIAGF
jgi:hypothetical protein